MNIFQCKKIVESYLRSLERRISPSQNRIRQVTTLQNSIQNASVLFPALGLDSLYPSGRTHRSTSVDRRKLQACHRCLQDIASQIDRLRDNQGQLCSELLSLETSIAVMICNLETIKDNGQHPIQGDDFIRNKYHKNICFLMCQGLLPAFGSSLGECYGLSIDYGRHRIANKHEPFAFQESAAEIQADQRSKHPGQKIFLKRLGQCEYEPNLAKQAKGLADYAFRHKGQHLAIKLKSGTDQHLCYLEYTSSGRWHYFEPNQGAFEFKRRDEFEAFYYDLYAPNENLWHSYQVSTLEQDSPVNTWSGKWRSFLTGSNYHTGIFFERVCVGLLVAITLGAVAMGVITPVVLLSTTMLPAAVTMALMFTCLVLFELVASVGIFKVINNVVKAGFNGVLALPRYIDYHFLQKPEEALRRDDDDTIKPAKRGIHTIDTLPVTNHTHHRRQSNDSHQQVKNRKKINTIFDYVNQRPKLTPFQRAKVTPLSRFI